MSEGKCCNHDCNQGRDCPVRTGTHKPAKAVHQIDDPSPVQAAQPATNHSETPNSSTITVPRGWKLVPDDATPEWIANLKSSPVWSEAVGECIKKFLAAAPSAPQAAPAAVAVPDERSAFEAWLGIKPCGAAHDFGWAAWEARAALSATQRGLEQFIEQLGDVHFQRCRVGSKEGEIRWDIEFGHYGAEVRGKTLREAITKALAAQAQQGEQANG